MLKGKKIYIVIWSDRHTDTTAHPFEDLAQAIAWAKSRPAILGVPKNQIKEKFIQGWLYYVSYSSEGGCLWITEQEIK